MYKNVPLKEDYSLLKEYHLTKELYGKIYSIQKTLNSNSESKLCAEFHTVIDNIDVVILDFEIINSKGFVLINIENYIETVKKGIPVEPYFKACEMFINETKKEFQNIITFKISNYNSFYNDIDNCISVLEDLEISKLKTISLKNKWDNTTNKMKVIYAKRIYRELKSEGVFVEAEARLYYRQEDIIRLIKDNPYLLKPNIERIYKGTINILSKNNYDTLREISNLVIIEFLTAEVLH